MRANNPKLAKRLAKNEIIFRKANEKLQKATEKFLNYKELEEMPLQFFCECSDENCREHVELTHTQYKQLHYNRKQFVIKLGHEAPEVERVIKRGPNYSVVEKFTLPPTTASELV